jgi:hypothetical protein
MGSSSTPATNKQ